MWNVKYLLSPPKNAFLSIGQIGVVHDYFAVIIFWINWGRIFLIGIYRVLFGGFSKKYLVNVPWGNKNEKPKKRVSGNWKLLRCGGRRQIRALSPAVNLWVHTHNWPASGAALCCREPDNLKMLFFSGNDWIWFKMNDFTAVGNGQI